MIDLSDVDLEDLKYDEDGVGKLALMQCGYKEIAGYFGVDEAEIIEEWKDHILKYRAIAKADIAKKQWEMARQGNIEMLRHVGGVFSIKDHR